MRKLLKSAQRGFTLLEVLVALTIFTLCATTLIKYGGTRQSYAQQMENKSYALWIAENTLETIRLQDSWPELGKTQHYIHQNNIEWTVETEISTTSDERIRKGTVSVSKEKHRSAELIQLTAYFGEHSFCCK